MQKATFKRYVNDSSTSEQELHLRGGQRVEIIESISPDTYDYEEVGDMYRVRFSDGLVAEAFADELSDWENIDSAIYEALEG